MIHKHHRIRTTIPPMMATMVAPVMAASLSMAVAAPLLTVTPSSAWAMPDTPENRHAEAVLYERAIPVESLVAATVAQVAALMPPEHRVPFTTEARASLDETGLRETLLSALADTFTADELAAMTAFFGSDIGRSISTKMTLYRHQVMPPILGAVEAVATRYAQEHGPTQ